MIDLGANDKFNPVNDFMVPCFKYLCMEKRQDKKYQISQLIITHPHDDHLSAINDFNRAFYPSLFTVQNDLDHPAQSNESKINWDLITNPSSDLTDYLRKEMLPGRQPPLRATDEDKSEGFVFQIYHLKPSTCENDKELLRANYSNNVSIMVRLNYNGNVILFCGDMMKDGMSKIISGNAALKNALSNYGVDFLVAPHHGLRSSFSTELFATMKNGRTRALNIISEKPTNKDSNEIVDTRYESKDYSGGHQVIVDGWPEQKRHLKTSASGHIRIDLFQNKRAVVVSGKSALKIP